MTDHAVLADPRGEDLSARLQERIRGFTSFYEQHAYLTYNLALRIACELEPAIRAVNRGFLSQLDERPPGLLPATVRAALDEAPSRPDARGAGDPEAEALMATIAGLPPPERAALALSDLAETDAERIGELLGVGTDPASKLLHRAREGFAARLGIPRPQADEVARSWMWAAPPSAIWEALYPAFHREVERRLRRGDTAATLVLTLPSEAASRPTHRVRHPRLRRPRLCLPFRRWSRRRRWATVASAILLLASLAGAQGARLVGGGASRDHVSQGSQGAASATPQLTDGAEPPTGGPASDVKPHKPLTPAELDKLRLQELDRLNEYTRRQADRRLPAPKRKAAARGIAGLQRAADQRLKAELRREQALRDQLARERARRTAPPPPPSPSPRTTAPAPRRSPPKHKAVPQGKRQPAQTCLLNEDSGQYVCAQ